MLFLLLKKERHSFLMYLYCIVIVILYCPLQRFFFIEIFNWDLENVSVVRRCPMRTVRYIEVSL